MMSSNASLANHQIEKAALFDGASISATPGEDIITATDA
jgi:hypothetical protein